jgi:hypothetical protein
MDGHALDALRGTQDDTNPRQIVCDRHRASTLCSRRPDVIYKRSGFQKHGIHVTDRMLLKE